jgi:hypothetical protein
MRARRVLLRLTDEDVPYLQRVAALDDEVG